MDLEIPVTWYRRENFDIYLTIDVSLIAASLYSYRYRSGSFILSGKKVTGTSVSVYKSYR